MTPFAIDRSWLACATLAMGLAAWWILGDPVREATARPAPSPTRPALALPPRPPPKRLRPRSAPPARDANAPLKVRAADRARRAPVRTAPPFVSSLRDILRRRFDRAVEQLEACRSATYLGFLGDKARLPLLLAQIDDHTVEGPDKLPALAALIEGFDDRRRLPLVRSVADEPASGDFARAWALELLANAGDKTRVRTARALIDNTRQDASVRVRAAGMLADMGDGSRRRTALALGRDAALTPATRARALAEAARMVRRAAAEPLRELRRTLDVPTLTRGEKLTVARHLCVLGDRSASSFLLRVIEHEASSVLDQLRALDALAMLGRPVHLDALHQIARHRRPSSDAARRVLVMMGDRSGIAELVESARSGDLDSVRTLVIAALLDRLRVTPGALAQKPRYRKLLVET